MGSPAAKNTSVAAPGIFLSRIILPISLFFAGFVFLQKDGIPLSETYSLDQREGGFQFLLDIGGHPLTWVVIPRIISSAITLSLMSAVILVSMLYTISWSAVVGLSSHHIITTALYSSLLYSLSYGFFLGCCFGFLSFISGVDEKTTEPGVASQTFISRAVPILMLVSASAFFL